MNKNKLLAGLLAGILTLSVGCSSAMSEQQLSSQIMATQPTQTVEVVEQSEEQTLETVSETTSTTESQVDSEYFSNRDLKYDVDLSDATALKLSGDVTITKAGTYIISGQADDTSIIIDVDDEDKVQLVLDGVTITNADKAVINVISGDKVFVTAVEGSVNTLSVTGDIENDADTNVDAVIFSKSDLTINGTGSLVINSDANHGITSKDDLVLAGVDLTVNVSGHGLEANDLLAVHSGTYNLTVGKDGLHSDNDDDTNEGNIYVASGNIHITSDDDGIHASGNVTIADGNITIDKSYEGIEGLSIDINGGTVDLTASDDGMNAGGGADSSGFGGGMMRSVEGAYLSIAGGQVIVDASGDGLDSNGDFYVSGGTVYISGPTNNGNGALDYNGQAVITGGTLIAAGSSGMAQNFGDASTQVSVLVLTSQSSEKITILDDNGNEVASFDPDKTYNSVVFSSPNLSVGSTYTVQVGNSAESVTITDTIMGQGHEGGMGGGPRRR